MIKIGIIGVNGLVGQAIIESIFLLGLNLEMKNKNIDFNFYGTKSGKTKFGDTEAEIYEFTFNCLSQLDYVILAVDNHIAKSIISYCVSNNLNIYLIDNSSVFRMDENVPLIIPEINKGLLDTVEFKEKRTKIISNPNCVSTIVCMSLAPLLKLAEIEEIVVSTYQAASGAGYKGLDELEKQTTQYVKKEPIDMNFWKIQYVGNVFSHNSHINECNGFNEEELKLINESKKILQLNSNCSINPTCIRVPTARSHCASLMVKFNKELSKEQIVSELNKFDGLKVMDGIEISNIPNPIFTANKTDVYVGRIRPDLKDKSKWNFWISGDQLLKGAGYNSVQILKYLIIN